LLFRNWKSKTIERVSWLIDFGAQLATLDTFEAVVLLLLGVETPSSSACRAKVFKLLSTINPTSDFVVLARVAAWNREAMIVKI
jgi:hypothetical protein